MLKPFLAVVALGAGIGFLLPTGTPAPPAAATPVQPGAPTELDRSPGGHFYTDAIVDGTLVHFVVDTGASQVALTIEDARRVGLAFTTDEFTVVGRGASGDVRGKNFVLKSVSVDGKEVTNVRASVLEGLDISLLGQAYLLRIGGVQMAGDHMVLR